MVNKDSDYIMLTMRQLNDFGSNLFMNGWWAHDNGGLPVHNYGTTKRDNAVAKAVKNLQTKVIK